MKKAPSKLVPHSASVGPKILRPQTQESITLANIFLLQGQVTFQELYGFSPNNYTFLTGSPREKACVMHFLLMIADPAEAKQQFSFLVPEKGSAAIHFGPSDIAVFRDRAYAITASLSNMAGIETMPKAEFLGFSAKNMNMMFRLSLYCLREQSKRLARRLTLAEFTKVGDSEVTMCRDTENGLSALTFFDASINIPAEQRADHNRVLESEDTNFLPAPLTPYCNERITVTSEGVDVNKLLRQRLEDIYQELAQAQKDNTCYEAVVKCLAVHSFETRATAPVRRPPPKSNPLLESAFSLLRDFSTELSEVPLGAYGTIAPPGDKQSAEAGGDAATFNFSYPKINMQNLRELHLTRIQPSSTNFMLACNGGVKLIQEVLANESLCNIHKTLFAQPETARAQANGSLEQLSGQVYSEQLASTKSSIKALQTQIEAIRGGARHVAQGIDHYHSEQVTDDSFTAALLSAFGVNKGKDIPEQAAPKPLVGTSAPPAYTSGAQVLRESLQMTLRAQTNDRLSDKLCKVFSGQNQKVPVTTLVASGAEGQLLQALYVGDD